MHIGRSVGHGPLNRTGQQPSKPLFDYGDLDECKELVCVESGKIALLYVSLSVRPVCFPLIPHKTRGGHSHKCHIINMAIACGPAGPVIQEAMNHHCKLL